MKTKKFDCVEMMHDGQAASKRRRKGMTLDEQLEYWQKIAGQLRQEQHPSDNSRPTRKPRIRDR